VQKALILRGFLGAGLGERRVMRAFMGAILAEF
jgi:hypothetical protein